MGKNNKEAKKLQEVITAKTLGSLNSKEAPKNKKAEAKKKTTSEEAIIVKPLKDKKSKKVEAAPVSKKEKKEKKASKKESTPRELKYTYPADCKDSLAKKKFRAECRAKVKSYEKKLEGLKEGSKEYKSVKAEYNKFKGEIGLRA